MPYISTYGYPLKPFTIYLDCHYLYKDEPCLVVALPENSGIDNGCAIILTSDNCEKIVNVSDITPIPLRIEDLDSLSIETTLDIGTGIKVWKINYEIPYTIIGDGCVFRYTNPIMEDSKDLPVELSYLSDLEAIHRSYESNPAMKRYYENLKRNTTQHKS